MKAECSASRQEICIIKAHRVQPKVGQHITFELISIKSKYNFEALNPRHGVSAEDERKGKYFFLKNIDANDTLS